MAGNKDEEDVELKRITSVRWKIDEHFNGNKTSSQKEYDGDLEIPEEAEEEARGSVQEDNIVLEGKEGGNDVHSINNVDGFQVVENPMLVTTADLKDSVDLSWTNINVYAELPKPSLISKLRKKESALNKPLRKQILFQVEGKVKAGTLLAVMGSSGAGKTTLMNVLAHHNIDHIDVEGIVKVNKRNIGKQIKSICAYVRQDDLFIGTLTVKEHLTFQAMLRMDKIYNTQQKKARVLEVMGDLGLIKCQRTMIGIPGRIRGISGGEARRLSFAAEILTNPSLLFVDEPTSGLDSFMAMSVISALQKMAAKGKTILATIHQPSSEVFEMFNSLLLMSEGRVAYMGSKAECLPFFGSLGFPCPRSYNPADHYISTLAIRPGEEEECRARCSMICDNYQAKRDQRKLLRSVSSFGERKIEQPTYKIGFFQQVRWLLWRSILSNKREPFITKMKIIEQALMALIAGLVYLQLPNSQSSVNDFQGAFFFIIIAATMGSLTSTVYVFPAEIPVLVKEHQYGMYSTEAYFIAKTIAEFPFYMPGPLLFAIVTFWMMGVRADAAAFFIYVAIVLLVNQASLAFGYFVSAISPTVQVAIALASPMIMPLFLFGGFFVADNSIRVYFDWIKYLSWFKYSFEIMNINQWDEYGPIKCDLPANSSVPCVRSGDVVLESLKIDPDDLGPNFGLMFALVIGYRLIAFVFVKFRTRIK